MQLKQFEGTSMEEILERVKKTLGEDALILSTRRKAKKGLGPFTKEVYEVSAAVDRTVEPARGTHRFSPPVYRPAAPQAPSGEGEEILFTPLAPVEGKVSPAAPAGPPPAPPFEAFLSLEKELAPLKEEIASLKAFLQIVRAEQEKSQPAGRRDHFDLLAREVRSLHDYLKTGPASREARAEAVPASGAAAPPPPMDDGDDWLVRRLLAQGVRPDVTRDIRDAARNRLAAKSSAALDDVRREAGVVIASAVRVEGIPAPPPSAPRILAFVGPPGSGKTVAVARAGRLLSRRGFRVAVVTVGERSGDLPLLIGGLQRRHGVPVLSAGTGEELSRAVATCFGANYILVDVAGRRCEDRDAVRGLAEMFGRVANVDFCLTLPAGWDGAGADDVARSLSPLSIRYLAFTRMDETRRFGGMVNAAVALRRPVLFLTAGNIPAGHIFPAKPYMFSRLLLEKSGTPQERTLS